MSRIMLVGGGSGGHITPLLAVAHSLKQLDPNVKITYVGHRGDNMRTVAAEHQYISDSHAIFAGKLRRYHGAGWKQLLDLRTLVKNIRDGFFLLLGLLQSLVLIKKEKPDIIFIKGGFVGVPIGKAARFWRVPYITHDSDAMPGLANRLLAKHASAHAVALPKELYTAYPGHKTVEVGVPVAEDFKKADKGAVTKARQRLGIPEKAPVLLVTGGGLGAQRLNTAIVEAMPELLDVFEDLIVLHVAGAKNEAQVAAAYRNALPTGHLDQIKVFGFTDKIADLYAAADVVISRAGATAVAELAIVAKPVIMVPNPMLTGGHQLKNAQAFADSKAAVVVQESELNSLGNEIMRLLKDGESRRQLAVNLHKFAKPDAAKETAQLILRYLPSEAEHNGGHV